jgi:hypothetical protein
MCAACAPGPPTLGYVYCSGLFLALTALLPATPTPVCPLFNPPRPERPAEPGGASEGAQRPAALPALRLRGGPLRQPTAAGRPQPGRRGTASAMNGGRPPGQQPRRRGGCSSQRTLVFTGPVRRLNRPCPPPSHARQGILRAMDGFPVTLRLLDPPLHEFLPDGEMTEVGRKGAGRGGSGVGRRSWRAGRRAVTACVRSPATACVVWHVTCDVCRMGASSCRCARRWLATRVCWWRRCITPSRSCP